MENDAWLDRAKNAYETSTTYVDTNYRRRWEDNLSLFQGQHPQGSKYHKDAYKYRSKLFRPKTRAVVRNNEAATAASFFANRDAVNVEPMNDMDDIQVASAELRTELINYRLAHTIPWFITCVGGMQDAMVNGVVISKQYWELENKKQKVIETDPFTGEEVERQVDNFVKNEPRIDLYPIENVRFSPAASWTDPINTSPYVILLMPMYVDEVRGYIERGEWKSVTDAQLKTARGQANDSTRQVREKGKEDPKDVHHNDNLSDFDIVWVHENFMRINGEENHFFTLGTETRLTDPKPLGEVYFHNMRPLALGSAVIETHTTIPSSPVELGADLQKEANEVANTRMDNVKLVLNKRYLVKRGKQVDIKSLVRNVPASVTMVNDNTDVTPMDFNDVTSSSFAEQDRVNVDYDELLGSFSAGSVQSNRQLNETVGGMSILSNKAGGLTQYLVSVFSETWVEKVIEQLDALEQAYETDQGLLDTLAQKLNFGERFGIEQVPSELLEQPAFVSVNVANSATDPILRVQQFMNAVKSYAEIQQLSPNMDIQEVGKEIFGKLGYRDGRRFLPQQKEDPKVMQMQSMLEEMQQAMQEMQKVIETKQIEIEGKIAHEEVKQRGTQELEVFKQEEETERLHDQIQADLIIAGNRQNAA